MSRNRILIGLRNEAEAKELSGYLTGLGLDAATATDGARTLELAIQDVPALIAVDTALPVIGGERLFQILRKNPHTSRIPFLFISDGVAEVKGFRAGVDIFLIRPLNLEETYMRIRQAVSARGSASVNKEIEGKLSHMSLADLLQFLHLNRKEGELKVVSGDKAGSVFIKDGIIHNALLDSAEKEKALFRMLQWTDGCFEFMPGAVTAPKRIRAATGNLLMEGMRQIDELRSKQEELPSADSTLRLKVDPSAMPKGLQPIIYEIVQLVRANPLVREVVERSQWPDYETYRTISSLVTKGVLEEARPAGEASQEVFLTSDQMLSIREKIMGRSADSALLNYARVMVVATSGSLAAEFMKECRKVPGFRPNTRSAFPEISLMNPLGEAGSLRLSGGMDLSLFSVPAARGMGPLWRAFSSNLVGLALLWDKAGEAMVGELAAAKKDILFMRRVPTVHIVKGEVNEHECAAALALAPDEHLFRLGTGDKESVYEVFYALFGALMKDEYAAS